MVFWLGLSCITRPGTTIQSSGTVMYTLHDTHPGPRKHNATSLLRIFCISLAGTYIERHRRSGLLVTGLLCGVLVNYLSSSENVEATDIKSQAVAPVSGPSKSTHTSSFRGSSLLDSIPPIIRQIWLLPRTLIPQAYASVASCHYNYSIQGIMEQDRS